MYLSLDIKSTQYSEATAFGMYTLTIFIQTSRFSINLSIFFTLLDQRCDAQAHALIKRHYTTLTIQDNLNDVNITFSLSESCRNIDLLVRGRHWMPFLGSKLPRCNWFTQYHISIKNDQEFSISNYMIQPMQNCSRFINRRIPKN